jgi:hypothetical protein
MVRLRPNFGQTAALSASFHEAQGSVVISLNGDLQHDPSDIPALLAKIEEGYDIASGWRKHRIDHALTRKLRSRIAKLAHVQSLRNATSRFWNHLQGIPRGDPQGHQLIRRDASFHHGACRPVRPAWPKCRFVMCLAPQGPRLALYKLVGHQLVRQHGPLIVGGTLLLLVGLLIFTAGLLSEILIRTYFESQGRRIYAIRLIKPIRRRQHSDFCGNATSSATSALFSEYPLPYIQRAMQELNAVRLAQAQKAHGGAVYQRDLFEVQCTVRPADLDLGLQLPETFRSDSPAKPQGRT